MKNLFKVFGFIVLAAVIGFSMTASADAEATNATNTGVITAVFPATAAQLTVEVFDRSLDDGRTPAANNAWTDWIKAKVLADLNIEVTFVPVGRWSEYTDIVNIMNSGTAPDLCYTYGTGPGGNSWPLIASFRDQGKILDLAPYIDSHLPDLKRLLGVDSVFPNKELIYRNADPQTGKIYSIHNYVVNTAQSNIFIRKDWLNKLGIALPTSFQEFEDALIAFRNASLSSLGINNVVPFACSADVQWSFADVINHHIDPNMSYRDKWVNDVHGRTILYTGYKEGVSTMNRWYNAGLINQNLSTMTDVNDFINMLKSGVVGSFSQNWDYVYRTDYNINKELATNAPGAEFVPVDLNLNNKTMGDKGSLHIIIPSSGNWEAALQYLNWLAKPENYHFLQVGALNVNHAIENGVPKIFSMPAYHPWFQNSQYNIDYTIPMNGMELGSQELNARVLAQSYGNVPSDKIVNAYAISTRNARAAPVYQATITVNQYSQVLQDKANALLIQAIRAPTANFDSVWDAGIADFLSSGAQAVINERASLWR